jgi:hypothetical protein
MPKSLLSGLYDVLLSFYYRFTSARFPAGLCTLLLAVLALQNNARSFPFPLVLGPIHPAIGNDLQERLLIMTATFTTHCEDSKTRNCMSFVYMPNTPSAPNG